MTHYESAFRAYYSSYDATSSYAWAVWREGRLAGIEADYSGEFSTEPALFEDLQIEVNARTTRSGSMEYELREKGSPLAGFTF